MESEAAWLGVMPAIDKAQGPRGPREETKISSAGHAILIIWNTICIRMIDFEEVQ
jgi:hypothetical protein